MRRRTPSTSRRDGRASLVVEHRRLRRVFAALLVAVAPAPLMQACSQASAPVPDMGGDAGSDARTATGPDAGPDVQTDVQTDATDETEAGDAGAPDCSTAIVELDASADSPPDALPVCTYTLPCGLPDVFTVMGCAVYTGPYPFGCDLSPESGCGADVYVPTPGVPVTLVCPGCLGGSGRRPRGLRRARAACAPSPAGAYFARMAHDEAASVLAFVRLSDELAAHGAPPALQRAASRARRDEERHARAMARQARMRGAPVPAPRVLRHAIRPLEAVARENAVEGCVNETFGALIAAFQAEHAPRGSLRRVFARIAADEARHAALSWAVARWAEARLEPAARARVAAARARALRALRTQAGAWPFDAEVGRPGAALRARLVDGMARGLALGGGAGYGQ